MSFFGDLGFPSVILVNKVLKALCLSFKMVHQHPLYVPSLWTYWHLKITQGPTRFSMGKLEGGKSQFSRAAWAEKAVVAKYVLEALFIYWHFLRKVSSHFKKLHFKSAMRYRNRGIYRTAGITCFFKISISQPVFCVICDIFYRSNIAKYRRYHRYRGKK